MEAYLEIVVFFSLFFLGRWFFQELFWKEIKNLVHRHSRDEKKNVKIRI